LLDCGGRRCEIGGPCMNRPRGLSPQVSGPRQPISKLSGWPAYQGRVCATRAPYQQDLEAWPIAPDSANRQGQAIICSVRREKRYGICGPALNLCRLRW
jgi:hypothetical protein